MSVPQVGFFPRIEAVTIAHRRFDLTRLEELRAWLNAPSSATQIFHIHQDDIAALEAAMKESDAA